MTTIIEGADLGTAETTDMGPALARISAQLDTLGAQVESMHRRLEVADELLVDLMPMAKGVSRIATERLQEMEETGVLAFSREGVKVLNTIATSFSEEDVRLLGENVVSILRTIRNLTQAPVLDAADRAADALKELESDPTQRVGLIRGLRDPEVRRGMTMLLTVLRQLGALHETDRETAPAVPDEPWRT